ncbi:MAG TPA: hypothetical protein VJ672_05210 [Gemmatimonadaceae bacterium]|nr:hypothetical protein [Gemmatimonadaceae bacterium]
MLGIRRSASLGALIALASALGCLEPLPKAGEADLRSQLIVQLRRPGGPARDMEVRILDENAVEVLHTGVTGASGSVSFLVRPGSYHIDVTAPAEYQLTRPRRVVLERNQSRQVRIWFQPRGA